MKSDIIQYFSEVQIILLKIQLSETILFIMSLPKSKTRNPSMQFLMFL